MANQFKQRTINGQSKTTSTVVTADAAYTVKVTDNLIILNSAAGDKVLTLPTPEAITRVTISMQTCSGGSYTATIRGGTLTFNAIYETAVIVYDTSFDGWIAQSLVGATVV